MAQETSVSNVNSEFVEFKNNVDAWIKQIRAEFNDLQDVSDIVEENVGNVQHNYELIYELKDEVERMKEELKALKLIQLVTLKKQMAQTH